MFGMGTLVRLAKSQRRGPEYGGCKNLQRPGTWIPTEIWSVQINTKSHVDWGESKTCTWKTIVRIELICVFGIVGVFHPSWNIHILQFHWNEFGWGLSTPNSTPNTLPQRCSLLKLVTNCPGTMNKKNDSLLDGWVWFICWLQNPFGKCQTVAVSSWLKPAMWMWGILIRETGRLQIPKASCSHLWFLCREFVSFRSAKFCS